MKTALVYGAGGFIGNHLVTRLKNEGFWVRGVDVRRPQFSTTLADDFILGDLRYPSVLNKSMLAPKQQSANDSDNSFDEVYQLAADMGGAGYIFSGKNDANLMTNSAQINLLVCQYATLFQVKRLFYSSSACIYPEYNQTDPSNPKCSEDSAYPAKPDSEYGWEKLFSERLYLAYNRNHRLPIHIARYHNIYGPQGTYAGGKEKAPAALCRKVAQAQNNDVIEVWGDGSQTRSFLYIDDCIDATLKLTRSDFTGPVNIGSEEMISINNFAEMVIDISGKNLTIKHIDGPIGVNGRNSDNRLIESKLDWEPKYSLQEGMKLTYEWINNRINNDTQNM